MQTSYEDNLCSNMSQSAKENISYEIFPRDFPLAEKSFHNAGVATRYTDGPTLPNKRRRCSGRSNKHDLVHAKQFIVTPDNAVFPSLKHNHEIVSRESHHHKANKMSISSFLLEESTAPILNENDLNIDLASKRYSLKGSSSMESSSVESSDKTAWSHRHDNDIYSVHPLRDSDKLPQFHHVQSATSHRPVVDSFTEFNLFKYTKIFPKLDQVHTSINNHTENNQHTQYNHTQNIPNRSNYMYASEAQTCSGEHRAYMSDNVNTNMNTSSEKVIGSVPNLITFSQRQNTSDSNAYTGHTDETRTKNEKINDFGPNKANKDDGNNLACTDPASTPKSVQAFKNGETGVQLNTSSAHETLQSSPSSQIYQKAQAQSENTGSAFEPRTPSSSNHSLIWRPVVFEGMKEINAVCEDQVKVSHPPKEKSPPQRSDLDKFWEHVGMGNSYICTFNNCNQCFSRIYNVRAHIKTHLDYRQYSCKICCKSYVRRHDLNRHIKLNPQSHNYINLSNHNFSVFKINA